MQRRLFLKASLTVAQCSLLLASGLLIPKTVIGKWQADVFYAAALDKAMQLVTGGKPVSETDAITLQVPGIVEDGRSVQITVHSRLEGTDSITLFSEKNPNPAVGAFMLGPGLEPLIDTRIKMGGSGFIIALVHAKGKFYSARRPAKVTSGGCG